MILRQKRIRNLSKLNIIKPGTIITPIVKLDNITKENLINIGFSEDLEIGESILPKIIGPITRKNANGFDIQHKDLPKETYTIMREWSYKQWIGGGDTKPVTEWVDVTRERYKRTHIEGKQLELVLTSNSNNEKIIALPSIKLTSDNSTDIMHEINLMLEIFKECEIVDINYENFIFPKIKRVHWKILPQGKFPWKSRQKELDNFIKQARGKNSSIIRKRLELIYSFNPDFIAVGNGGFSDYLILGFSLNNTYILESTQINNATYIIENDWDSISKMSKCEIIHNNYCKERIIHDRNWFKKMNSFLSKI